MTKPTIKSPSSSLSQVTRPKPQSPIHRESKLEAQQKLHSVSKNAGSSPLLIWTLIRTNAQENPEVLSLFKNSKKNAQSLDDLAEIASTIEQTSNSLDKVTSVLQNIEDRLNDTQQQLESLILKQNELEESTSNLSFFSDNDLEAVIQSLGEDFLS